MILNPHSEKDRERQKRSGKMPRLLHLVHLRQGSTDAPEDRGNDINQKQSTLRLSIVTFLSPHIGFGREHALLKEHQGYEPWRLFTCKL